MASNMAVSFLMAIGLVVSINYNNKRIGAKRD